MTEPLPAQGKRARLLGGIHRDITGRVDEPLRFYLAIDRGLKSGRADNVEVSELDILRLILDGARALEMLRERP